MLHISATKQVMIWLTVVVGLFLALPNGFYSQVEAYNDAVADGEEATGWPSFLPSGLVNLGLDLRGGAHLLAEVQVEDAHETIIEALWPEIRQALGAERATIGPFRQSAEAPAATLRIQFQETDGIDRAVEVVRGLARGSAGGASVCR